MSSRKLDFAEIRLCLTTFAAACLILTSCGGGSPDGGPRATPQGTVSLDTLKVGAPEALFKDAVLTFVPKDTTAGSNVTEYISRTFDRNGGQIIAQCQDNRCIRIFIHHTDKPISKAVAEESMKNLMPTNAGESTKVTPDKKNPKNPVDFYEFANGYRGSLIYSTPSGSEVATIGARFNPDKKSDTADATGKEEASSKTASDEPSRNEAEKTKTE